MKRCLRREERGISPIIATILLITATVAAASIIAVYVAGLYVPGTRIVAGDIDTTVYDNDNTATENYKNENILITFYTTQGYLRNVGDPERGLTVTFASPRRGWGPIVADVKDQTNYAPGYVEENDTTEIATGQRIAWKLYVPVTAAGRLEEGVRAYLYVRAVTTDDYNGPKLHSPVFWDDEDDWTIQISCYGDAFTTSYGTVRLLGTNWIA